MTATQGQKKILKTEIELFITNKVKELRKANNIGQKKLSLELRLSISFVGRAENPYSKAKYNLNHLNEIARFFNVPFSYFFPETHLEKDCIEEYKGESGGEEKSDLQEKMIRTNPLHADRAFRGI